jgi:glucokinase
MQHENPSAVISEPALAGTVEICVQALDMFVAIYGAEAGNLALKLMATGGVFIGGGIAPKIASKLRDSNFMEAFADKGRFRSLLESIPVRVIMNDKTALLGAANYAAMQPGV